VGAASSLSLGVFLAALGARLLSPAAAEAGNAARGERTFQRCFACHSVDPAEPAKLQGPSLFKIVGRPAAAVAGFAYSEAMQKAAAAGLVWDAATLDRFLTDPEAVVAGTAMVIPPMRDSEERADLVAYLERAGTSRP
jgi:cytochrome c